MLRLEQVNKVKRNVLLILILIFFHFSCFLYVYKPQSIEKRLSKHAKDISRSDISKIDFKGLYIANNIEHQNKDNYIFDYYKFFTDGKVYHSKGSFDKNSTKKEFKNLSIGEWSVYYIKENKIYIEQFNGYNGYTLLAGFFNESNKQIVITDNRKLNGQIIILEHYIYSLELVN